jgi:hypothetical protein
MMKSKDWSKGFLQPRMLIDVAKDEFTLTPCIGGYDDTVCLVKAGTYHLELFECRMKSDTNSCVLAYLSDDNPEGIGRDGSGLRPL